MSTTEATTYCGLHSVAPPRYRGRHRVGRGRLVGLTVLGAIWVVGLALGSLSASGVGR